MGDGFDDSTWDTQPTTNLHFGDICGIKGLNYDAANALLVAFNNEACSLTGRVW